MSDTIEIIKHHLEVAGRYTKDKRYDNVIVIGNRIQSDLLIDNKKSLMLIGWMLKELSIEIIEINKRISTQDIMDKVQREAIKYVNNLKSLLDNEVTAKHLWELYFGFEEEIRSYHLLPQEDEIYKEDYEFTRKYAILLLNYFCSNKKILVNPKNIFINGIVRELSRSYNEHGGTEALITYLVFKVFERVYNYLIYSEITDDNKLRDEYKVKSEIDRFVDDISTMIELIEANDIEKLYEYSNWLIGELTYEYRTYYISYGDLPRLEIPQSIKLPPETEEKIDKIIKESFKEKE
ncbi:MAG: hypothetical protein SVY15_04695 [Halobacteriota archaeon]|nr:hypothetical protein [Halobacteriota archaeon]